MHGDCLERMKEIPDGSVDMILTDPPYGTTNCKWDSIIPLEPMWEHLKRIIKPNGAIVMTASQPFTTTLIASNIDRYRESITWIKHKPSNFGAAKYKHLTYTEDVVVFAKSTPTYNRQMQERKSDRIKQAQKGGSKNWRSVASENEVSFQSKYEPRSWDCYDASLKNPMDYIEIPAVVSNSKEKHKHPTQKPVALMEYLIKTYTNEGEIVLDFTMGSGTTGVAALNTNREFIGIEKDDKYFDIAKNRINQLQNAV